MNPTRVEVIVEFDNEEDLHASVFLGDESVEEALDFLKTRIVSEIKDD